MTAGQRYRTSIFAVGWDDNTTSSRTCTLEASGERTTVDISFYNNNNGIRIDYEFDADASTKVITVDPLGGNSFHFYGFANVGVDALSIVADPVEFTQFTQGDLVSTLSAFNNAVAEPATFAFAAGGGDADNGKFQLVGSEIQIGTHDFAADPDGTTYSVRVSATATVGGAMAERALVLTKIDDSDVDDLPDAWELAFAADLTVLSGLGGADSDGDNLTDLEEFNANPTGLPNGLDPTNPDSDGDDLQDGAELAGAGDRPATDPTNPDTDGDTLTDGQESNTGTYVDADDTGSDPTAADTDGDGYRDAFEALRGGEPSDAGIFPAFSPAVSLVALTDDETSGIDMTKTYTHAISGGGAATINGVNLEEFSPTVTPANFAWDTAGQTMNQITLVSGNLGDWNAAEGGVTGAGLLQLLGGFTYSGSGANAGSMQSYTLSNLTPGQSYLLRVYVRVWDTEGSGRPADISFTNGGTVEYAPILEDRPSTVLGGGASVHSAYAIEYTYVAEGTDLIIGSAVPIGSPMPSGSYHMFGLTNEIGGPAAPPEITGVSYDPETPSVTITFNGQAGKDYALDVATELKMGETPGGWVELNDAVPSTGEASVVVDTIAAGSSPNLFYRLRDPEEPPAQ